MQNQILKTLHHNSEYQISQDGDLVDPDKVTIANLKELTANGRALASMDYKFSPKATWIIQDEQIYDPLGNFVCRMQDVKLAGKYVVRKQSGFKIGLDGQLISETGAKLGLLQDMLLGEEPVLKDIAFCSAVAMKMFVKEGQLFSHVG